MQEDGTYIAKAPAEGEAKFNIHQEFFKVEVKQVLGVKLVEEKQPVSSSDAPEVNGVG